METILEFFKNRGFKRIAILAVISVIAYFLREFANIFLITFILAYLMYRMQSSINRRISKFVKVDRRITIAVLYILLVAIVVFGISRYLPVIVYQVVQIVKQAVAFYMAPHDNAILDSIIEHTKKFEIGGSVNQWGDALIRYVADISKWGFNIFVSLILSLFFLLEQNKIMQFTRKFKYSKLSSFYIELEYFCQKFIRSFGKVIEVQILIAIINGGLSVIALSFIGIPDVLGLGIMIFVLGLIPVAGVFISLVPLSLTAYASGGPTKVIYVIIIIAVLHALEGYVLNPKLMSSKTELPVFYTFIILIISEHFFGVWGLIIGIPVFIFILDLIEIDDKDNLK
ncbi:AI-2E family transporter [Clostridium sp. YIM B02505]|uniref:AI-2E family transporter n=1 Tax=Clostridium yunnanense TaxID=2800325 RepID=A0ABS1EQY3_9CLOT|nr:AI-2E family transporter [Clostridium yunnanense]MBK1811808.1 AI-2E family transporter [Clostridium yunnanense]